MDKKQLTMLIMAKKTLDYQKDPNPDNWVTMKGSHVHLENGKIDGGAGGKFNGQSYKGTKKQAHAGKSTGTSSKKYESKAREAVEYWVNTHYKNPSDKNIKESVDNVRSQMEHRLKTAERNLNDAKKTGKEELIKNYQDKYDEAKGTLEALNNYYDGGTVKKEETAKEPVKKETKNYYGIPYGSNGVSEQLAYELHSRRKPNSSFEEETAFSVQDLIKELNNGLSLEEAVKKVDKQWQPDYPESRTPIYYFMKSFNERNGKKEAAKEPKKPAVKNSAAESLIDYVKQQTNIDLSKHRDTEREKRGQLLINWKELDRNQKFAIQTLAQKGKFELIDNGGYGYILKPTKEQKNSAPKSAGNKDVRVKLKNGVTLRWQEVPGEPDKVYNPETREMYDFKGGLKAAIEKAKSQGAEIEDYEKSPSDPYQAESKNRQDRSLARSAAATRRAGKRGRPPGAR